jgi:hypothetical protein
MRLRTRSQRHSTENRKCRPETCLHIKGIVAIAAQQGVGTCVALKIIVPQADVENIVSYISKETIVAIAAPEVIITSKSMKEVISGKPIEDACPRASADFRCPDIRADTVLPGFPCV